MIYKKKHVVGEGDEKTNTEIERWIEFHYHLGSYINRIIAFLLE